MRGVLPSRWGVVPEGRRRRRLAVWAAGLGPGRRGRAWWLGGGGPWGVTGAASRVVSPGTQPCVLRGPLLAGTWFPCQVPGGPPSPERRGGGSLGPPPGSVAAGRRVPQPSRPSPSGGSDQVTRPGWEHTRPGPGNTLRTATPPATLTSLPSPARPGAAALDSTGAAPSAEGGDGGGGRGREPGRGGPGERRGLGVGCRRARISP